MMEVSEKPKPYAFDAGNPGAAGLSCTPSNESVAQGYVNDGTVDKYVQGGYQNPYAAAPQDASYAGGAGSGQPGVNGANAPAQGAEHAPGYVESAAADGYQTHSKSKSYGQSAAVKASASTAPSPSTPNGVSVTKGRDAVGAGRLFGNEIGYQAVVGDGAVSKDKQALGETKEQVSGNAENGTKVKTQTGAWSNEATRITGSGVAASGSGAVGAKAEAGGSFNRGPLSADGSAKGAAVAEGRGSLRAEGTTLQAGGEFQAGVSGDLKGSVGVGPGKLEGSAGVFAGAEGTAGVFAGVQDPTPAEKAAGITSKAGVEAKAGGFVGAKASASGTASMPGGSVTAGASARAGFGAEAGVNAGIARDDKGKYQLNLGANLGLSIGVGASVNLGIKVDVTPFVKVAQGVDKVAGAIIPGWGIVKKVVGTAIKMPFKIIGSGLKNLGKIFKGIGGIFKKIGNLFKKPESKSSKTMMNDYAAQQGKSFKQLKSDVNNDFEKKAEAKEARA